MSEQAINQNIHPADKTQDRNFSQIFHGADKQSVPTAKWFESLYPKATGSEKEETKNFVAPLKQAGDAMAAAAASVEKLIQPDPLQQLELKAVMKAMTEAAKAVSSAVEALPDIHIST